MSSRSPSPASSLGFAGSDNDSDDYRTAKRPHKGKAHISRSKRSLPITDHDLKPDHAVRPLWIDEFGHIILEAFSPFAKAAQDFLITIAEPVSRPLLMHEYAITKPSLHSAMSVGLNTGDIIDVLARMSKVPLPNGLVDRIREWTLSYGKIKLVLENNKYFLESSVPAYLQQLITDRVISTCRLQRDHGEENAPALFGLHSRALKWGVDDPPPDVCATIDIDETDDVAESKPPRFEISAERMEDVRKRCKEIDLPALEEYDFHNDAVNPDLKFYLKPNTQLRPYQETSLAKMFGNGRARSGIIVLPCGAGKTLVGVAAACRVQKSTLVLCTSAVSVSQWKQSFLQFTNLRKSDICAFTRNQKEMFQGPAGVVVSTYSMVANTGKRSEEAEKVMQWMQTKEWGFLLLDEVHVVPADMFRKCVNGLKVHAKLGLTATLVREDDKISDLNFLVGPKLYEANWMDLSRDGYIATVLCAEVWCPMTQEFYHRYLRSTADKRRVLHAMNPNKIQACQFLIDFHEGRGDKIIVFSDNVYALTRYAQTLGKPFIHGGTGEMERMQILGRFQTRKEDLREGEPEIKTIFLSKVGDTSLDLPEATCLIQISSHFGSRRQEAQRLGRILRAKRRNDEGFNAFFYSLVSTDTEEMYFSAKRQGFLIDQGYAFKVITELEGKNKMPGLVYSTAEEQRALLKKVVSDGGKVTNDGDEDMSFKGGKRAPVPIGHTGPGGNKGMPPPGRASNKRPRASNGAPSLPIFRKRQNEIAAAKKRKQ